MSQACADKLDRELSLYGIPPQFPPEEAEPEEAAPAAAPEVGSEGVLEIASSMEIFLGIDYDDHNTDSS